MMSKSLYEQRREVTKAIDMGEWKHSWHLPENSNGEIDWFAEETRARVERIIYDKRERLMRQIALLDSIEIPEPDNQEESDA